MTIDHLQMVYRGQKIKHNQLLFHFSLLLQYFQTQQQNNCGPLQRNKYTIMPRSSTPVIGCPSPHLLSIRGIGNICVLLIDLLCMSLFLYVLCKVVLL